MKRALCGSILVGLLATSPGEAGAQVTFEGCRDQFGNPVASVLDPRIPDIAMAGLTPAGPAIFYNPLILAWVQPQTRIFFYAHECAHHNLGHTLGRLGPDMEQQADCWAVRELVGRGLFGPREVQAVQQDLARFGRADPAHLPGPTRAMNLPACLR